MSKRFFGDPNPLLRGDRQGTDPTGGKLEKTQRTGQKIEAAKKRNPALWNQYIFDAAREYLLQELAFRKYGEESVLNHDLREEFKTDIENCTTLDDLDKYAATQNFTLGEATDHLEEWALEKFEEAMEEENDEDVE